MKPVTPQANAALFYVNEQKEKMSLVPNDLWHLILSHLSPAGVLRVKCVNWYFHLLPPNEPYWERSFIVFFPGFKFSDPSSFLKFKHCQQLERILKINEKALKTVVEAEMEVVKLRLQELCGNRRNEGLIQVAAKEQNAAKEEYYSVTNQGADTSAAYAMMMEKIADLDVLVAEKNRLAIYNSYHKVIGGRLHQLSQYLSKPPNSQELKSLASAYCQRICPKENCLGLLQRATEEKSASK